MTFNMLWVEVAHFCDEGPPNRVSCGLIPDFGPGDECLWVEHDDHNEIENEGLTTCPYCGARLPETQGELIELLRNSSGTNERVIATLEWGIPPWEKNP